MAFHDNVALVLIFMLVLLPTLIDSADPTAPPKPNTPPPPRPSDGFVNPITQPIRNSELRVHIRKFSQIPDFRSANTGTLRPSRLTGMAFYKKDLYVTTSTAGALIYRILPDGSNAVWVNVQNAVLSDTGRNVNCETTQHGGLRGLAFPPDHETTGLFYVSYMEDRPANPDSFKYLSRPTSSMVADSVVVELKYDHVSQRVVSGSYRSVLRVGMTVKDHPIKQITFQNNFLLIGHGDGSLGSNPSPGGMNNDGLGKIIRINPKNLHSRGYGIPSSNPWFKSDKYMGEIYAVGFRNPHNLCWSQKHGLFVADIGRDNVEEVNIVESGANHGWGEREGTFVNLRPGGTLIGIAALPSDDAKFNYTYPVVQMGHFQPEGGQIRWGIAIAGSCPVETNSPLKGLYFYCNFGERGELYYSFVGAMKRAVSRGKPSELTQAIVYRARKIMFHKDGKIIEVDSLVEMVSKDIGRNSTRVDARFGKGPNGEIYVMSKVSGSIYVITNTIAGSTDT